MNHPTYIGIGASAGGLEALKTLLTHLPIDQDYIYIIAQHLDPKKSSDLSKILSSFTDMKVNTISQKHHFRSNSINVIPAGYNLVEKNSKLILEERVDVPYEPTPSVNRLFIALANIQKKQSVGIILSGTGHDGTKGIIKIKENGGVTIAQSTTESLHTGMPQSAIDSGSVDYVLTTKEIAQELISILNKTPKPLLQIANLLREKEKFDINKYKIDTIMRRLDKRMLLVKSQNLYAYVEYINTHPEEVHLLYQNILIGVTDFFRNEEAFDFLKERLFEYLKHKEENYEVRIWSIACSTGEEAYSLAIIIDTISKELGKKFTVRIFATDIDENALRIAKQGFYPPSTIEKIDKDISKKYFIEVENGYKIISSIRSQIVFTKHNILTDPPFINQDIISCRNLLIYILQEAQDEIFTLLHYSLKDDGILFLGSSESTFSSKRYFKQITPEHKLYIRRKLTNPPKISSHYFSKHLEQNSTNTQGYIQRTKEINIEDKITKSLFEFFSEWSIVVDENLSIVYKKGDIPFLTMPDGYMTTNIIDNITKELRHPLRKLLKQVFKTSKTKTTNFTEINTKEDKGLFVKIIATPLHEEKQHNFVLLYFQTLNKNELYFDIDNLSLANEEDVLESLTNQIQELQEDNEELSNEKKIYIENMQLLNEELQSSNEELQSSNEELETSNEELQSSNEELHTSIDNEQKLQKKFSQILNTTGDGIIGLDLNAEHTFANRAALNMFGYTEDELLGTKGHLLWHHTKADGTVYDIKKCTLHSHIQKGTAYRGKDLFWRKDGSSFEVEVLQNPIIENGIVVGTVISFHDITEKNRLKREVKYEEELAKLYMNTLNVIVLKLDINANITMINEEGCRVLQIKKEDAIGKNFINTFLPKKVQKEVTKVFHSLINKNDTSITSYSNPIIDTNHKEHLVRWTNSYTIDIDGNITGVITSGLDVTNEQKLSRKLFEQEHLYRLTFEEADIGIAHTSLDDRWIDVNEYLCDLLGYSKEEFQTLSVSDVTSEKDAVQDIQMREQLVQKRTKSYHTEKRYIHKDGTTIWVAIAVVLLYDEFNKPLYFLKIVRDISQLKLLMYQLELEKEKFEKMIEFAPIPILIYDEDKNILLVNKVFTDTLGYKLDEIPTISSFIKKIFSYEKNLQNINKYYDNPTKMQNHKQVMLTKEDKKKVEIINAVALSNNNMTDKKIYMLSMLDITDMQKKDELMLAQSRQAAMGDMLAMIAHQWRQPLSVIAMVANNLQVDMELQGQIKPQELSNLINTLNHQTQYLSQTIDDFRDFFKPDRKKEHITIIDIIQRLQNLTQKALEDNNIRFTVDNKLEVTLYTYPNQLIQVLINIINNAKDALNENEISEPHIDITVKQINKKFIIEVCDNGGGLNASIKDKLGEPYVTTKSKNGTGLGIYMSKIIMEKQLHGELIWETDEKGCCFSLIMPMKENE
ncbi:PAS domain S-box protein [Sulfurimonas sp.]